jgi:hypothetical protein
LDHVLIFGERHLLRTLTLYAAYYNQTRTHLGLGKDAPLRRAVQRTGTIVVAPVLSGLHHRYARIRFSGRTMASWQQTPKPPQIVSYVGFSCTQFPLTNYGLNDEARNWITYHRRRSDVAGRGG